MSFNGALVDCKNKEISCFLCLEDMVSVFELLIEPIDDERDFYIELKFVYDIKQYDKPVLLHEDGLLPYCHVYDVTDNNNDKNPIVQLRRYAGVITIKKVENWKSYVDYNSIELPLF